MVTFFTHYYTLFLVIAGAGLIGSIAGGIGAFALVRGQSMLGDAMSHAALPGIALMFLMTGSTDPFVLLLGGSIAGGCGALFVSLVLHKTTLKRDALLGIVLSVFFGFGIVLKTIIQKRSIEHQAILGKFFFGNASTLLPRDVLFLACIGVAIFLIIFFFWKEFKILAFDRDYAFVLGYPVLFLDILLTILIVIAIVMGLHAVGVLLMSAMLIAPAAAARQWTSRLSKLFFLAVIFGAFSGIGGAFLSSQFRHIPTGPMIVILASICVSVSLVFSPHRGVLRHIWSRK